MHTQNLMDAHAWAQEMFGEAELGDQRRPKRLVQLLFCPVELGQILRAQFPPQFTRTGDVKSVAAGVNNSTDVHATTNIVQIAAAENRYRRLCD